MMLSSHEAEGPGRLERPQSGGTRKRKNILVVGVPRSGTSLTTATFARKGYYVGGIESDRKRDGDDDNPFGYFEADDVIARNVALFQRVGYQEHNTWLRAMIPDQSIADIARLTPSPEDHDFVRRYHTHAPWVWKDPRLCLTLAYWWKLMVPADTGVVLVRRDIDEVCRSFRRMGYWDGSRARLQDVLRRIDRHLQAAQDAVSSLDIPHIVVEYRDYLQAPDQTALRLGEFCRVPMTAADLNVRADLNHSTLRGRIAARLRAGLDRGFARHMKLLKPIVPERMVALLLPEKKYRRHGTGSQEPP